MCLPFITKDQKTTRSVNKRELNFNEDLLFGWLVCWLVGWLVG